jgi:hypothetical protein
VSFSSTQRQTPLKYPHHRVSSRWSLRVAWTYTSATGAILKASSVRAQVFNPTAQSQARIPVNTIEEDMQFHLVFRHCRRRLCCFYSLHICLDLLPICIGMMFKLKRSMQMVSSGRGIPRSYDSKGWQRNSALSALIGDVSSRGAIYAQIG